MRSRGATLLFVVCACAVTRPISTTTTLQSASDVVAEGARTSVPYPPVVEAPSTEVMVPDDPPEPIAEPVTWPEPQWSKILAVRPIVLGHAETYRLDPALVLGLVWIESKFEPRARGPGGSRGLVQLMPATGKSLAKSLGRRFTPDDPDFSVEAGCYYLRRLLDKFDQDEAYALAAYNRGPGAVAERKAAGEPLSEGMLEFVAAVQSAKDRFARTAWPEADEAPDATR